MYISASSYSRFFSCLKDDGHELAVGERLLVLEDRQDGPAQAREEEAIGQNRRRVTLQRNQAGDAARINGKFLTSVEIMM
jgi:hypothetical protein